MRSSVSTIHPAEQGSVGNAGQLVQDGNGGSGSWWGMAGSGGKGGNGGNGGNGGVHSGWYWRVRGGMVKMVRTGRECLALSGKGGMVEMVKMAGFWWRVVMRSGWAMIYKLWDIE